MFLFTLFVFVSKPVKYIVYWTRPGQIYSVLDQAQSNIVYWQRLYIEQKMKPFNLLLSLLFMTWSPCIYNILGLTDRFINCHMALKFMKLKKVFLPLHFLSSSLALFCNCLENLKSSTKKTNNIFNCHKKLKFISIFFVAFFYWSKLQNT